MKKFLLFALVVFIFMLKAFPQAKFSIAGSLCENNELNFIDESLVVATAWNWNFDDGTASSSQNPTHSYADTGFYTVTLTITSNGIAYNTNKNIHITAHPLVSFAVDSTTIYYSSYSRIFTDSSTSFNPVNQYIWNFNDGSNSITNTLKATLHKFPDKGSYPVMLKVIDKSGCMDSTTNIVTINNRYYIPNVFTPNGDTFNDDFIVTSNGITLFSIEIYSRWGNLVFKRSGREQILWDGRMPDGSLVQPGTYYYVISSESGNETYDPEKGYITVFH